MTDSHFTYLTYRTKNCWRSIEAHFAMGVSALPDDTLCHSISVTILWGLVYRFHIHFPISLRCFLIMYINIFFKYTLKFPLIVDNVIDQKSHSLLSILVFTVRFAQKAAFICLMDVYCITMQQIVYYPVDGPFSVSKSGSQSSLHLQSLAYASRLKNWVLRRGVCIYTYPGGAWSIMEHLLASLPAGDEGGILGSGDANAGGGVPTSLRLQRVCGFFAVPVSKGRQHSV